jgi:hypothetical protein
MTEQNEISLNRPSAVTAKKFHPLASKRAQQLIDDFTTALIFQAKLIAFQEKAELVLQRHIDEAINFIFSQKKKEWVREFLKIMGGALIGAFIPGLIVSLPANDVTGSIIYIAVGFAGLICVFIGLTK